jgi:hypothetical protein
MIPGWKVKRELLRLRQQIAWYWELTRARRRTRHHDRDRPSLVTRSDGPLPQRPKVAALLMFQPGPMPASITEECDLLTSLGYSVLVVSNGPLQPQARADLLPHVWRLLERPNLGYDFGGYREAVMHLWDAGIEPDELLILNDSVWVISAVFPSFLDRLAALQADVTGAVMRSKKHRRWLESYFFRFNRAALVSPAFRAFWRDYRLVDSKFGVIRQGERDFTVALTEAGLRIAALADNLNFVDAMARAPDEELRMALAYAAPVPDDLAEARARLLAEANVPHWRAKALEHLAASLDGKRVWNAAFPVAALRVMNYPFVKKSREPVNMGWRAQLIRAVDEGVAPELAAPLLAEMKERQQHGVTTATHWSSVAGRSDPRKPLNPL